MSSPESRLIRVEGEGEAENEWASIKNIDRQRPPINTTSYAPQGPPMQHSKGRRKLPHISLKESSKGMVAQFHTFCSVRRKECGANK